MYKCVITSKSSCAYCIKNNALNDTIKASNSIIIKSHFIFFKIYSIYFFAQCALNGNKAKGNNF